MERSPTSVDVPVSSGPRTSHIPLVTDCRTGGVFEARVPIGTTETSNTLSEERSTLVTGSSAAVLVQSGLDLVTRRVERSRPLLHTPGARGRVGRRGVELTRSLEPEVTGLRRRVLEEGPGRTVFPLIDRGHHWGSRFFDVTGTGRGGDDGTESWVGVQLKLVESNGRRSGPDVGWEVGGKFGVSGGLRSSRVTKGSDVNSSTPYSHKQTHKRPGGTPISRYQGLCDGARIVSRGTGRAAPGSPGHLS